MTNEEREQALSEEDYIELRHRFGTVVENVVRDMVSSKGERWEQAQAESEDAINREDVIALVQCSEYELQDRVDNDAMCDDVRKLSPVKPQPCEDAKAIPTAQDDDYVMIKRTTWEKIEKALDSVSARGC